MLGRLPQDCRRPEKGQLMKCRILGQRVKVTHPSQLPSGGTWTYRVEAPSGKVTEHPIRRDFIAYLMSIDGTKHPSQHLGELTIEETETGWSWVPEGGP